MAGTTQRSKPGSENLADVTVEGGPIESAIEMERDPDERVRNGEDLDLGLGPDIERPPRPSQDRKP